MTEKKLDQPILAVILSALSGYIKNVGMSVIEAVECFTLIAVTSALMNTFSIVASEEFNLGIFIHNV